jgi:predicted RecB family nuclease
VHAYLDVEGLPDRGFYYLIGLLIDDGMARRQVSLWADREADQRGLWDAFLATIRGLGEEFVLYHYGSYEARFLKQMADRYGGDLGVIARLKLASRLGGVDLNFEDADALLEPGFPR